MSLINTGQYIAYQKIKEICLISATKLVNVYVMMKALVTTDRIHELIMISMCDTPSGHVSVIQDRLQW
jgi:hypothetical protein